MKIFAFPAKLSLHLHTKNSISHTPAHTILTLQLSASCPLRIFSFASGIGSHALSSSLNLSRCPHPRPVDSPDSASVKTLAQASEPDRNGHGSCALRSQSSNGAANVKELADKRKMEPSELQSMLALPFLVGAKKMEKCLTCNRFVNYSEELRCTVQGCKGTYHLVCARQILATVTPKNF